MPAADEGDGGRWDAFDELVRHDIQGAMRLARCLTGNEPDAEEIVTRTYLAAWKALPGLNAGSSFATWRSRIEIAVFKDWLRAGKSKQGTPLDDAGNDEDGSARLPDDSRGSAETALNRMNPISRFLLDLRHAHEMTYEDILDFLEALLKNPQRHDALPYKQGLSFEQIHKLHAEICDRHCEDPFEKRKQRNAFNLKLLHARDDFRGEMGGAP